MGAVHALEVFRKVPISASLRPDFFSALRRSDSPRPAPPRPKKPVPSAHATQSRPEKRDTLGGSTHTRALPVAFLACGVWEPRALEAAKPWGAGRPVAL